MAGPDPAILSGLAQRASRLLWMAASEVAMTFELERLALELTDSARLIPGNEILAYPFGLGSRL